MKVLKTNKKITLSPNRNLKEFMVKIKNYLQSFMLLQILCYFFYK